MARHMRPGRLLPLLALAAALSLGLAVSVGSTPVALSSAFDAVLGGQDSVAREVILNLRLPRALNAFNNDPCSGRFHFVSRISFKSLAFSLEDMCALAAHGSSTPSTDAS